MKIENSSENKKNNDTVNRDVPQNDIVKEISPLEDVDDEQQKQNDEVIEDDWGLSGNFHLFAQHEPHPVYITKEKKFSILCVESLTPLDMVHLGSGIHDATGHCVWTGACLLVAALMSDGDLLLPYFRQKRVIELGCGTGIGAIAVMLAEPPPSFVALTDADPEALKLCRRNCELNFKNSSKNSCENSNHNENAKTEENLALTNDQDFHSFRSTCNNICEYVVAPLCWGDTAFHTRDDLKPQPCPNKVNNDKSDDDSSLFDTILATDVLYDIGLLPPLFQTARDCLQQQHDESHQNKKKYSSKYFVLSHVPRACYNSENPPVKNLDEYIIQRALEYDFQLKRLIRPNDIVTDFRPPPDALNNMSLEEMQDIEAAIFVFQYECSQVSG